MKTISLKCPDCGADLKDLSIEENHTVCFCQYCGGKILLDDETLKIDIKYEKRDVARIKEAEITENIRLKELEYKEREAKRDTKIGFMGIGIMFAIPLIIFLVFALNKCTSEAQGKISAGNSDDYIGQNYEAVVMQLSELGFENIVTVDLDDSGILFWENETVESVSIDGDTYFESINYFYPDDKVIVTYH